MSEPNDPDLIIEAARNAARHERYSGVYQRGYQNGAFSWSAANPAPVGLREAAAEVVTRWFDWMEGEADQTLRAAMIRLRAALAESREGEEGS